MNKLIDAFSNPLTGGGIFSAMVLPPWGATFIAENLDIMFFTENGNRVTAPLVDMHTDISTGKLSTDTVAKLAALALSRYGNKWLKDFAVMSATYNPINNYDMTETETGTDTTAGTGTATGIANGTNSENIYGVNSTTAVPQTTGGTDTTTTNETETTETANKSRSLNRSGNIGVTTSQQMLKSEIDLWEWNYLTTVFSDVAEMLTLGIYE